MKIGNLVGGSIAILIGCKLLGEVTRNSKGLEPITIEDKIKERGLSRVVIDALEPAVC